MTTSADPTDRAVAERALRALPLCVDRCTCPDRWHVLWSGIKATGLARTLHAQQDFLRALLSRHLNPTPHVMIAGAADTGSLDVLCAAIDDPEVQYSVLDLCPAPLDLVRQRAVERGLALLTEQVALDAARADRPWDLVFIHYTLGFMTAEQRLRFLRHVHEDLAPGGTVVCAVRQKQPLDVPKAELPALQRQRAADWARDIEPRFAEVCAHLPDVLQALRQWLPAYALSRLQREDEMPSAQVVSQEFAAAGFERIEAHDNPGQVGYGNQDLSQPGSISTWIGVFRPLGRR